MTDSVNQNTEPVAQNEETQQVVEAKEDLVKYETYKRVLNEKKKTQERLQELEGKLAEAEKKKLEETQNYKALYENQTKKLSEVFEEKKSLESVIHNSIKYRAVSEELNKRGLKCHDYDALFALGNTDLLQLNDDKTVDGVDAFVDEVKKTRNYLFATGDMPKTNNMPPSFNPENGFSIDDFMKLPKEQQALALRSLTKGN